MSARLPPPAGLLIDRARPLRFRFEGREQCGFAGDSLASALIANGVRTLSRSFKYHRPRGPLTMAGNDANTLVRVGDDPATLADRVAVTAETDRRAQLDRPDRWHIDAEERR